MDLQSSRDRNQEEVTNPSSKLLRRARTTLAVSLMASAAACGIKLKVSSSEGASAEAQTATLKLSDLSCYRNMEPTFRAIAMRTEDALVRHQLALEKQEQIRLEKIAKQPPQDAGVDYDAGADAGADEETVNEDIPPEEGEEKEEMKIMKPFPLVNPDDVETALRAHPELVCPLVWMEETGGAPIILEETDDHYLFADSSTESPRERRDISYPGAAILAKSKGVDMMTEGQYWDLQKRKVVDRYTRSWLESVDLVRTSRARSGSRDDKGEVRVNIVPDHYAFPEMGWRSILRVPKPGASSK